MKKLLAIALLVTVGASQVYAADGNYQNEKRGRSVTTQVPFDGGDSGG